MSASIPVGAETYSSAMADAKNYISWILESFSGYLAAPVLEIGVGHGSYASLLRNYGEYIGVDIDPASVDEARERFPDLDFRVVDITSPEMVALASERKVKTIVCLNVIEHIEDDAKAVTNLAQALQPGGHLLIIVPALELLFNDLDRLAGHHRRYSRNRMQSRLVEAGLDVVRCDYFNSIGVLAGWPIAPCVMARSTTRPSTPKSRCSTNGWCRSRGLPILQRVRFSASLSSQWDASDDIGRHTGTQRAR